MQNVNRCALIVRPKQPYIDWANGIDDEPDASADQEHTVYLAPDFFGPDEARRWLKREYSAIFEEELSSWITDEATWPSRRDFAMFEAWFSVEFCSMVIDLSDEPLERDEL